MANSPKGAGNFLGPLAIVAVLVVGALVVTFSMSSEEVPDEATIIAEDDVEARPAGAGTVPEGEVDPEVEGIEDEIDEVDPAAPSEDSVPPAEAEDDATSGEPQGEDGASGDTASSETETGNGVSDEAATGSEQTGGDASDDAAGGEDAAAGDAASAADGGSVDDAASSEGAASDDSPSENEASNEPAQEENGSGDAARLVEGDDDFVVDEESGDGQQGDGVSDAESSDLPAGRDAEVELNPEPGQDIVEDTDDGGSAFVPTPSGPEGRDEE